MTDLRAAPPSPETPAPPTPHRRWRGPLILLLVLLAVGAAGVVVWVGASGDAGVRLEEPPPPEEGAPASVEQEVLDAWRGYWAAIDEVNRESPDPADPRLSRYATDQALENIRAAAARNRDEGLVIRLPESSVSQEWPEVLSVEGDTATVRSCQVDDGLVVRAETGEVVDDDVMTFLVRATLVREDGWKVSYADVQQSWEGLAGCALQHQ